MGRLFPVLGLLTLFLASAGAQQQTDPDTAIKQLDKLQDALEQEIIQLEAKMAALGSPEPWPPPDTAPTSPEQWKAAMLAAPLLAPAGLIEKVESVDLKIGRTPDTDKLIPPGEMWLPAVSAVHAAGSSVDPSATVQLKLGFSVHLTSVKTTRNGEVIASKPIHMIAIEAGLAAPIRVLRPGGISHAVGSFASVIEMSAGQGHPNRAALEAALNRAVKRVFDQARGAKRAPADPGKWAEWLQQAPADQRLREFQASFQKDEKKLDPGLRKLAGFGSVSARYIGLDVIPMSGMFFNDSTFVQSWKSKLGERGWSTAAPGAPRLRHELRFVTDGAVLFRKFLGGYQSRVSLLDSECLSEIAGEIVRFPCESYFDSKVSLTMSGDVGPDIRRANSEVEGRFLERLGSPTRGAISAAPASRDAEAVERYLRSRLLVELPDSLLSSLANRIALTLQTTSVPADTRKHWYKTVDGETVLDLGRVGYWRRAELAAASTRRNVERAVDTITAADPLLISAFDNLFGYDRSSQPIVYPRGFADRFKGSRPTGAGALRRETVMTAYWAAFQSAFGIRDDATKERVRVALVAMRDELEQAKMIRAEYIPADGALGVVSVRHFWYDEPAIAWTDLQSRMPAELPIFQYLGGPTAAAPARLAEANAAVAGYRAEAPASRPAPPISAAPPAQTPPAPAPQTQTSSPRAAPTRTTSNPTTSPRRRPGQPVPQTRSARSATPPAPTPEPAPAPSPAPAPARTRTASQPAPVQTRTPAPVKTPTPVTTAVQPPAPARRAAPRTGTLIWTGKLSRGAVLVIQDNRASTGQLRGQLPGVPVKLRFPPDTFELAAPPSAADGWTSFRLTAKEGGKTSVAIRWTEIVDGVQ